MARSSLEIEGTITVLKRKLARAKTARTRQHYQDLLAYNEGELALQTAYEARKVNGSTFLMCGSCGHARNDDYGIDCLCQR